MHHCSAPCNGAERCRWLRCYQYIPPSPRRTASRSNISLRSFPLFSSPPRHTMASLDPPTSPTGRRAAPNAAGSHPATDPAGQRHSSDEPIPKPLLGSLSTLAAADPPPQSFAGLLAPATAANNTTAAASFWKSVAQGVPSIEYIHALEQAQDRKDSFIPNGVSAEGQAAAGALSEASLIAPTGAAYHHDTAPLRDEHGRPTISLNTHSRPIHTPARPTTLRPNHSTTSIASSLSLPSFHAMRPMTRGWKFKPMRTPARIR